MDWMQLDSVSRYSSMEHSRPADTNGDTSGMRLSDAHGGPVPGVNAWTLSGSSSGGHGWEVPSHDWAGDESSSPGAPSLENNTQASSPVGGASIADMHRTGAFVSGAIPERNGTMAPPAGPSFSPGRMTIPRDYSGMVGVNSDLELGFAGGGEETAAEGAKVFISTASTQHAPRSGEDAEDVGVVPSRASKPQSKKKPSRPRTPKKKAKSAAAPVRQLRKVKRKYPPEMSLGPNGRARALAVIQRLVDSPLSDEFHKPVVQLHPEVRPGQIRSGWCCCAESLSSLRVACPFLWHALILRAMLS